MSPEYRKKIINETILETLEAQRPGSLPSESIQHFLRHRGVDAEIAELNKELDYQEQKGYVQRERSELSQKYVRWKITAAGVDFLDRGCVA